MNSPGWRSGRSVRTGLAECGRELLARLPMTVLKPWTAAAPCVLLYHAVAEQAPAHWKHVLACRTPQRFRRDLDLLLQHFQPVSLEQLKAWSCRGEPLPPQAFHLTVDDGLREAVETIAPMCQQRGVPATFFLTTDFLDNRKLGDRHLASLLWERIRQWPESRQRMVMTEIERRHPTAVPHSRAWRELLLALPPPARSVLNSTAELVGLDPGEWLRANRPYATFEEIANMVSQGFTIGAHSVDHPYFPQLSLPDQVRQTLDSARRLEESFRIPCDAFAFPFGADGIAAEFYDAVIRDSSVRLFFGVGRTCPAPALPLIDRVPLDNDSQTSAATVLRRAFATRLEHRARGIRPRSEAGSFGASRK